LRTANTEPTAARSRIEHKELNPVTKAN